MQIPKSLSVLTVTALLSATPILGTSQAFAVEPAHEGHTSIPTNQSRQDTWKRKGKRNSGFSKDNGEPTIHDLITGKSAVLPRYVAAEENYARVLHTSINKTHSAIHYLTHHFNWNCYGRTVAGVTFAAAAGGATMGAMSGFTFVPVAPFTITSGAIVGGVGGFVGGVVGGLFYCW